MTNNPNQPNTLPDLPEFESATLGGTHMVVISWVGWLIITTLAAGACLGIYYLIRCVLLHGGISYHETIAVAVLSAAIIGTVLLKINWMDCQWTTGHEGITIRGLIRERLIHWSDVSEVTFKQASPDKRVYTVKYKSGKILLSDLTTGPSDVFVASLYQHLNRLGKVDESILSSAARSFWTPIPKEVPIEMDWQNPNSPNWSITLVVALIVIIGVPVLWFLGPMLNLGHIWNLISHWSGGIIPAGYKKFRERLIIAKSVWLRTDRLEVQTPRRHFDLPWSRIKYVHWDLHGSLTIGESAFRDVTIIPFRNDRETTDLMLAIIRCLRAARFMPPVAIPKQLAPALAEAPSVDRTAIMNQQSVEYKPTSGIVTALVVIVMLFGAVFVTMMWIWDAMPRIILIGLMAFGFLGLVELIRRSQTRFYADCQGITKIVGKRKEFTSWQQIATYRIKPIGSTATARHLMNAQGTSVLIIMSTNGDPKSEQFTQYLDAHLASVREEVMPRMMR